VGKRDIYNITAEFIRRRRRGVAPPAALIRELKQRRDANLLTFKVKYHPDRAIKNLLIVDAKSIEYLNDHGDEILGDATYKTNKFGMPCFHVIGIDGQDQAYTVLLAFIDNKTEENYDFPISHLARLYKPSHFPSVFAYDADPALIASVKRHFPAIRTKVVICY